MVGTVRQIALIISILIGLTAFYSTGFTQGKEGALRWQPGFPSLREEEKEVYLAWVMAPYAVASYNVYRSNKEGDLGTLLTNTADIAYLDTGIKNDRSYYYTIKVVVDGSERETSPVGAILINRPILAPMCSSLAYERKVYIRFGQPGGSSRPKIYNIYKTNTLNGDYQLVGTVQYKDRENIFIDNFDEKSIVYYKVTAVDKNNIESPMSESIKVEKGVPIP